MPNLMRINVYVDGNNLYRGAKELGFKIDYNRFRMWLSQKYNVDKIVLVMGFISQKAKLYNYLRNCGYILVFKPTASVKGITKGNCDAELVLQVVSDYYTNLFESCYLITGDGDFGCLADFLIKHFALAGILPPDRARCSFLLKNKKTQLTFLNDHYHKFSTQNKKAPDADVSA